MTRYRSRTFKFPTGDAMLDFIQTSQPKMCVWNFDHKTIRITIILEEDLDTGPLVNAEVAVLKAGGEPLGESWEEKSH